MAPAEENKKKVKKLVVEETSAPEAPVEAIIEEDLPKEDVEEVEEVKEEVSEEPAKRSVLLPPEIKEEKPQKTSLGEGNIDPKDSKVNTFWVILLALFIIASLVGGGVLVFRAGVEKGKLEASGSPQATSSPTETLAPTALPEVKREDLKIEVLNGTGKAGVAGTAKEYLEGLGYKDVTAGNADSSDFTKSEISIKETKKSYSEILKSDLEKKYEVVATTKTLSSASDFDAVVTIGTSTK